MTTRLRTRVAGFVHHVLPDAIARRIAQNAGWLLGERVLRMFGALLVTIWVVRYLGPSDFGVLAYAISLGMIGEVASGLGVAGIVVRELVRAPEDEAELLGSSLAVRFISGVAITLATILFSWLVDGDARTVAVVSIVMSVVPLRALTSFDQAFQARMQSRLAVIARLAGFAISSLVKLALLIAGAPLEAIAAAVALEVVVSAASFVFLYARSGYSPLRVRVNWGRARSILRESWPLAIAAVSAMVALRIDQVMLKQMATEADVGSYAAAARLSEIWYFVPVALGTALFPALVGAQGDRARYGRQLQAAFDLVVWVAIVIALVVAVAGGLVIRVMYGAEFADAAAVLRLHVWAGPFVFMGVIAGRAMLAEGQQGFEAFRYIMGAPLNVGLNLFLIPAYGGTGAAVATLISYIAVTFVAPLIYPPTRPTGWMMVRAFLLPFRLRSEYARLLQQRA